MDSDFVINDDNWTEVLSDKEYTDDFGRRHRGYGAVPRTFEPDGTVVRPMRAVDMPLLDDESKWMDMAKRQEDERTRLDHLWAIGNDGKPMGFLSQGSIGYCWNHGPVHAIMALRAKAMAPFVPLSAFAAAAIIKSGRDEGGWGALGLEWASRFGVPSQKFWPQGSRNVSQYATQEMYADAATRKVTEGWMDAARPVYDRDLSRVQVATLALSGVPVVADYNWWGHCVTILGMVVVNGQLGFRIQNSWDGWGVNGTSQGTLTGSKMWPDNAVAPRAVMVGG